MTKNRERIDESKLLFSNSKLKALIIPLVIEQFLNIFVGMADAVMVSSTGEAALSAVSLVDMMNSIVTTFFAALATGGAVVSSHFIGAQDFKNAKHSANQLVLLVTAAAILIMTVVETFKRSLLLLFFGAIEQEVMKNAIIYFGITAASYPFIAIYSGTNALFRSMGNSKITMKLSILMNTINIAGNAVLIYGFDMGVAGAAYATLVARLFNSFMGVFLLSRSKGVVSIRFRGDWRPDFSILKRILRIGIPNGMENSFFQLGRMLVTGVIATFGTTQIAANATAGTVSSFATVSSSAMSLAMITVIGQCVGAGDLKQTVYYIKKMMKISYSFMAVSGTLLMLGLPFILKLYNLSTQTERLAYILVSIMVCFGIFLWPASFNLPNVLRASNNVAYTMVVSMVSMTVFRISGSYVIGIGLGWGAIGVWLAMVADWVFRIVCFCFYLFSGKWKKRALRL